MPWLQPLLPTLLQLVFQNLLLEMDERVQQASLGAWQLLLDCSSAEAVAAAIVLPAVGGGEGGGCATSAPSSTHACALGSNSSSSSSGSTQAALVPGNSLLQVCSGWQQLASGM